MKHLLIAVLFFLLVAGCSNENPSGVVNAPADESHHLNIGTNFTPTILPPNESGPTITLTASDTILWPPNKKWKTVTFSGTLSDYTTATYTLTDEYGKISYSGSLSGATYSVPLKLKAERKGKDKDGRTYTFTVTAIGSFTVSVSVDVVVPHDRKKPGGNGDDDDDCDDDGDDD